MLPAAAETATMPADMEAEPAPVEARGAAHRMIAS
ncbi:hypothetical protein FHS85_002966 [Rhodoligotrophos appendicifer]